MAISARQVKDLAMLARLEISEEEAARLRPQLESILDFVAKLSELDTDQVEPMTTALDVDNRWREDVQLPGLDREAALSTAPAADEECFRVPPVLG